MEVFIVSYYIVGVIFALYLFRQFFITPNLIFTITQMIMFTGILTYCDTGNSSDCKLIVIYFVALCSFVFGTLFYSETHRSNLKKVRIKDGGIRLSRTQSRIVVFLLVASLLICTMFFVRAGYNVFFLVIKGMLGGGSSNMTDARIALNSLGGVGYVYQFRVIILPITCAFLLSYTENKKLHRLGVISFPLMIAFILGTGQRGGFVMFVLMWMVALLYIYKFYRNKKIKRAIILILVLFVVIFGIMTIFNGRVASDSNVVKAMLKRIFDDNQQCAVIAFRYIDTQPIQFGKDWILALGDILPGKNDYLQLSYRVFEIMYGTTRGTAPPCIWGSTYYNWGWLGIIAIPFIIGFLYHKLYVSFSRNKVSKISVFLYSAMFVVLGNWMADSPVVLFNTGFVTLVIMKFLLTPKVYHITMGEIKING